MLHMLYQYFGNYVSENHLALLFEFDSQKCCIKEFSLYHIANNYRLLYLFICLFIYQKCLFIYFPTLFLLLFFYIFTLASFLNVILGFIYQSMNYYIYFLYLPTLFFLLISLLIIFLCYYLLFWANSSHFKTFNRKMHLLSR